MSRWSLAGEEKGIKGTPLRHQMVELDTKGERGGKEKISDNFCPSYAEGERDYPAGRPP